MFIELTSGTKIGLTHYSVKTQQECMRNKELKHLFMTYGIKFHEILSVGWEK